MVKRKAKVVNAQQGTKHKTQKKKVLKAKAPKEDNIVRLPANRAGVKANEKNTTQILLATIIVIVIIAIVFMTFFYQSHTFVIEANGITYYSNEYTPTTFFKKFSQNKTIYVSPFSPETGMNNLVSNSMNLWLVVLAGNQITPVQLIRIQNDESNLVGCYTNYGDVKTSEFISTEECEIILNNPENAIVLIEVNGSNTVYMEKNKIIVNAASNEIVSQANLFVMRKGFPNADEIILKVNQSIANIS